MNMVVARDVRGIGLESVFVQVVMSNCPEGPPHDVDVAPRPVAAGRDVPLAGVAEWEILDEVSLQQVFQKRFSVLQSCPVQMKGRNRQAARVAIEALETAAFGNDEVMECGAWKLFLLLPFMLLRRPLGRRRNAKSELARRFDSFAAGRWDELLKEAEAESSHNGTARVSREMTAEQKAKMACQKIPLGEVSRTRQCLTGAALAPSTKRLSKTFRTAALKKWCDR